MINFQYVEKFIFTPLEKQKVNYYIKTRMTEPIINSKEMSQDIINRIALKKFGNPLDVANAVLFLTSPAASYITFTSYFSRGVKINFCTYWKSIITT